MVQTALASFWHALSGLVGGLSLLGPLLGFALLGIVVVGFFDRERFRR